MIKGFLFDWLTYLVSTEPSLLLFHCIGGCPQLRQSQSNNLFKFLYLIIINLRIFNRQLSMQQESQLNRSLPDTVINSRTYNKLQESLFVQLPQYKQRIQAIQLTSDGIISKPKQVVNLFESSDFVKADRSSLVRGWIILVRMMIEIFEKMPINSCLVYQGCKFGVVKSSKEIDFVAYVIVKIDGFLTLRDTALQQDKDSQLLTQIDTLLDLLVQLYQLFVINCNIPPTSFHFISRYLCLRYHQKQLNVSALSRGYQILSYVGKYQHEAINKNSFSGQCAKPCLYFDGHNTTGIKLILTDNRWVFAKLMHICLWLKPFFRQSPESISILHLKTDDNKILRIIQQKNCIAIQCVSGIQRSYRSVCDFPINSPIKLQIQLDARQSGLFTSNQYVLNLIINGKEYREIQVKVPRFSSSSCIKQFNLLQNYFGLFYSMVVANSEIVVHDSILSQDELQQFLATDSQSIITVLSPLRIHSKILINHINPQQNHAYHQASYVQNQAQPRTEVYKSPQLCLPLLYFCSCVYLDPKFLQLSSTLQQTLNSTFNKVLTNLCEYLFSSENPQTNQTSNNIQLSTLFILYFLQLNRYPITQKTLNIILENSCTNTFSGYYLHKYLDFNALPTQKVEEQPSDINLGTKVQLLYLLETQWKKIWNKLQHSSEWWMPGLKFQNNRQFHHSDYQYKKIQQDGSSGAASYQWIVSQFITNDFCDCLLVPLITTPNYADFNHYRQTYINRQLMGEYFDEPDIWKCFLNLGKGTKRRKYQFKQNSQSLVNMIKRKLYRSQPLTKPTSIIDVNYESLPAKVSKESGQYFEVPVCYMNLLTLVIGTISIRIKPTRKKMLGQHSANSFKNAEQRDDAIISFYPKHDNKQLDHLCVKPFKQEQFKCIYINCQDVKSLRKRRYNQSMNGLQIRLKSGVNYLFYFYQTTNKSIDKFISKLCPNILPASIVSKDPYEDYLKSNYTIQWIDKQISNYEYLQYLNDISGRSYSDITQYPVLPWVFVSDEGQIDFTKQQNYRNLMKNMGSLGPEHRKEFFLEKYETNNEEEIFSEYHYGTHYSSSAIIFNFLIRLRPFSTGAITLQSGKFDCADRVFSSYIGTWNNATTSTTDIRELVPEIYILPQMMINVNNYDFGLTQLKQRICNVQLPKWADSNPYKFCVILRKALQKQYTSSKIKHWIDLVYGYKQKGKQAIENMNIFFPLTYQLAINLDKISDNEERISFETQIAHFGQNPAQIIGSNPHPDMLALKKQWQNKLIADCNQILLQKCQLPTSPITQDQHIFQSVFEKKKSILGIKFMSDTTFFVLRRHQFTIFRMLDKKSGFISKQKQVEYQIEKGQISFDYINIQNTVPIVIIDQTVALIGGLYHGNIHIIFLSDVKYSGNLTINMKTVSALTYYPEYKFFYVGDSAGNLGVYEFSYTKKDVLLTEIFFDKIHALRINSITCNHKANLFITASEDGAIKIFNLYSQQFYRKLMNPFGCSVIFASISTCPLYCVVFYSRQDSKVYTYSLNGQFLASKEQVTGFVYNLKVEAASDHTEHAISLNANRQLVIDELPFLKAKKKIKLKKDDGQISCFEMTNQIIIAGNQQGGLQILADASLS